MAFSYEEYRRNEAHEAAATSASYHYLLGALSHLATRKTVRPEQLVDAMRAAIAYGDETRAHYGLPPLGEGYVDEMIVRLQA